MWRFGLAALLTLALAAGVRAQTTTTTLPSCAAVAALAVWAFNESDATSLVLTVDGDLDAGAVTCGGGPALAERYEATFTCTGTGLVQCGRVNGLRPGAWVHRVRVQPAGAGDPQRQTRRGVIIGRSDARDVANPVVWPVYGFARAVTTSEAATLRTAVAEAGAWTAANPGRHALLMLHPPGPVVLPTQVCPLDPVCTGLNPPKAGLCLQGDRLVLDGRGEDGRRAAELAAGVMDPVLRIYGADVEVRGLVLAGSRTATSNQADTVDFMHTARRSALVGCLVRGPSVGDGVGAQCSSGGSLADANLVIDSEIREAKDKGVKVSDGAWQVVSGSCVRDNRNGGIQATLGGHVVARENVVQHNVPESAEHGIFASGSQASSAGRSSVATRGNIVRFAGSRGLSVVDDASGDFRDDYVARNQFAGLRVETAKAGVSPSATVSGVATVCNQVSLVSGSCSSPAGQPCVDATDCASGARCTTTTPDGLGISVGFASDSPCACTASPCPCAAPTVILGDGTPAGWAENATNVNKVYDGANLHLAVPGGALAAGGTQWEGCSDPTTCDAGSVAAVAAANLRTAAGATVSLLPLAASAGRTVTLTDVSPARPRAGDIVRVYGAGFDAINGTALSTACHLPPRRDADFCDPSDPELAEKNRGSSGNRLRLVRWLPGGGSQTTNLDLVAVTPTMLAFRMPHDCFGPARLRLTVGSPGATVELPRPFCDPDGCEGQPAGVACVDDGYRCTSDLCDGAGMCRHDLLPPSHVCRSATGPCDLDELCTGGDATCPADGYRPAGAVCRAPVDLCDKPEVCSGESVGCPADARWEAGHACRPASGACDLAETCPGGSGACPADAVRPRGSVCRAVQGACDLAETCDGTSAECPADLVRSAGVTCRALQGPCDLAEACDGSSPSCPADAKRADACRPATGPCDLAETCDGASNVCPADARQPPGTVCRPEAGGCDLAERCDGTSIACPADDKQPAGAVCRDVGGDCDVAETCPGASDVCPADAYRPAGATCRPALDVCDLVESCDGTGPACPADARATGFAAVRCALGQLDDTVRTACEPRAPLLARSLVRAKDALARAETACTLGKPAGARRWLRRVSSALQRFRRIAAADACLSDTSSTWTARLAAAGSAVRESRASPPQRCRAPR